MLRAVLLLAVAAGCGSTSGPDAATPTALPSPAPPAPAPAPAPPPAPEGPSVCLPVAACNMFVRCALAEPAGTSFRVVQYEHHPQRVGELWPRAQTCWDARGEHRCADALQYTTAVCTPVPPAQMELDYACRMDGNRCIVVEN